MSGTLYVVATPIGNLADITKRGLETLQKVDLILAEDTRISRKLLNHYDIVKEVESYHHHSKEEKKEKILRDLITGKNIALVTDAGTPGISDPGNELISYLVSRDPSISVVPIPGPSALTSALSASGVRSDKFVFIGFLPKRKRTKLFKWVKEGNMTLVFYESPKRLLKSLQVVREYFGDEIKVVVARELTKIHESILRGRIEDVINDFSEGSVKGELVVIVDVGETLVSPGGIEPPFEV
jgi:16S rRNA (cytidine1402-2'-O)-methyltransferase